MDNSCLIYDYAISKDQANAMYRIWIFDQISRIWIWTKVFFVCWIRIKITYLLSAFYREIMS